MFDNRADAGSRLGDAVRRAVEPGEDILVLGIPRGGVIVAGGVARAIGARLGVVVTCKLGAPANEELGIGAVAGDGTTIVDEALVERLHVSGEYLEGEIAQRLEEVRRRETTYRAVELREPAGRRCVIVDDGVATGATARAALASVRRRGATRVILAVPVAPQGVESMLEADDVVVLETPRNFLAVGHWYREFGQVTDEEVRTALGSG